MSAFQRFKIAIFVTACFVLIVHRTGAAPGYSFTTLAGNAGYGSADGPGASSRFYFPQGAAVDDAGNVYVADTQNCTIRKIDPTGGVSTLAGVVGTPGAVDTVAGTAQFKYPLGLAVDGGGNVYVADTRNSTIRMVNPLGIVTTIAGSAGTVGVANGTNSIARFNLPAAVTVDEIGNLYVADTYNSTIRMITGSGTNWVVTTIAGQAGSNGQVDGTNGTARFYQPSGIAVDTGGNLFVADTVNSAVRKITRSGSNWVTTTIVNLTLPRSVAVDGTGNVYVADATGNSIRKLAVSGTNWTVSLVAGLPGFVGSVDGNNIDARFNNPSGIASTTSGTLFVADTLNNTVRAITPSGAVSTLAGEAGGAGDEDGSHVQARFNMPQGVACDMATNIYVTDTANNCIRRITPQGVVTTLAGLAGPPGSNDGLGTNALFNQPAALVVDSRTNIYIADSANNEIRLLAPSGTNWLVTTLTGHANAEYVGAITNFIGPITNEVGGAIRISTAFSGSVLYTNYSAAVTNISGKTTNVIIVVSEASTYTNVFKGVTNIISLAANIFTLPPFSESLAFYSQSTYVNYAGFVTNIIGEETNVTLLVTNVPIVSVTNITTGGKTNFEQVALTPVDFNLPAAPPLLDGSVANALFNHPSGITMDDAGNLYVADGGTNGIRFITPGGSVSTLSGSAGFYPVSVALFGTNQLFYHCSAVALDGVGNVYVADDANNTIRQISPNGTVQTLAGLPGYSGIADGTNGTARFGSPTGLALDAQTNLFVTDGFNHTIRKISRNGTNWVVTTVGGSAGVPGSEDGIGNAARFNHPGGIAIDSGGNLYIADTGNNTIRLGQAVAQTTPVFLRISVNEAQVILSWPASATGFQLETCTSLGPNASWYPLTNLPVVVGDSVVVTNDATATVSFFRLRMP